MKKKQRQQLVQQQKIKLGRYSPKEQAYKEFVQKYQPFVDGQTNKLVRAGLDPDDARQVVLEIVWSGVSHPKFNPMTRHWKAWIFQRVSLHVITECKRQNGCFIPVEDVSEWGGGAEVDGGVWGQRFPDTEKQVFARLELQEIDRQAQHFPVGPRRVLTALIRETDSVIDHAQSQYPPSDRGMFKCGYEVAGGFDLAEYLGIQDYGVTRHILTARSLLGRSDQSAEGISIQADPAEDTDTDDSFPLI